MGKPRSYIVKTKNELFKEIEKIHFECYQLCKLSYNRYFENSGNIGIFCQSEEEYLALDEIRKELTRPSDNPNQKYFRFNTSYVIPPKDDIPGAVYEHLYIRKPDPTLYGKYSGDIDFIVDEEELQAMLSEVKSAKGITGATSYTYNNTIEMIQLTNEHLSSVAYISTKMISQKMRTRF